MAYMYITVSFFETFFKLNIYLNDFYMYFISHFLHGDISSISLDVLSVPMYGTVTLSTIGEFIIYRWDNSPRTL